MNTLRKIQTGLAMALVTAFAVAVGSSSANAAGEPLGETAEALLSLTCTMSGDTATGRIWAKLVRVSEKGGVVYCSRMRVGGEAPIEIPSCHSRKYELGCDVVLD